MCFVLDKLERKFCLKLCDKVKKRPRNERLLKPDETRRPLQKNRKTETSELQLAAQSRPIMSDLQGKQHQHSDIVLAVLLALRPPSYPSPPFNPPQQLHAELPALCGTNKENLLSRAGQRRCSKSRSQLSPPPTAHHRRPAPCHVARPRGQRAAAAKNPSL